MHIGFTSSRHGLSHEQIAVLRNYLIFQACPSSGELLWCHHGDCVGGDATFHELVRALKPQARIMVHPPLIKKWQAHCVGDLWEADKSYADRNHDIVESTQLLLACPLEMVETNYGGTWMTIRYARRLRKPGYIILRDGTITDLNGELPRTDDKESP